MKTYLRIRYILPVGYPMIGMLVNIRSALNVGSIFRTADGAGFEKLYLCGITPAPVDVYGREQKDIAKTALGAEKSVAWEKVGSTIDSRPAARCIRRLKERGFRIIAVEQNPAAVPYYTVRLSVAEQRQTALVVGYEIVGIPRMILALADTIVDIPMRGMKESLNVSVAFGIVAYGLSVG